MLSFVPSSALPQVVCSHKLYYIHSLPVGDAHVFLKMTLFGLKMSNVL